jgi:uncharacterized membrane protein YsdA (DUF1294 family)
MTQWGTGVLLLYGVLIVVAVAGITSLVHELIGLGWFLAYLVAINTVALAFYGYDKALVTILNRLKLRIPERVLIWGLAFPGGFVGAWSAMLTFHHKTGSEKQAFRVELLKACAAAFLLALAFLIAASLGIISTSWLDRAVEFLVDLVLGLIGGLLLLVGGLVN